ncbi:glycoside hydrolase family 47 protein [Luteimonas sp. A1P009]|uniref:Glycoside hydrolase family 47 protein n=1 Tax=Luteimonas fraxinea TaxID=2901869 RepID=A0ABS8U9Q2_9GAMM|nr:glycoside hydrolase family 47 protein [Luteimonas fraxinea]MCD9095471.1 glycoside hydrolase family 47 protein [Luteimonas fraxinea]
MHVAPEAQRRLDANGADAVMAERVKAEFLHGWRGYRQYAWGRDALKPLSNTGSDWYAQSLLMTPVDALDTLLVMGLTDEADAARELIATQLSFDKDLDVKHFEIVIRLLGGLLSGYQMTGDARLLALADDLGTRLLPAFDSPTGLPYVTVNLRTGKTSGTESNPAESGTLLLEYGTLARLTGKQVYWDKAWRALEATYAMRSPIGLVGERFDVETGQWTQTRTHVGARIDSYYEYLWKCWQLFAEPRCKTMWDTHIAALNTHVADEVDGALWYGHVDMATGARIAPRFGALDAFLPRTARGLRRSRPRHAPAALGVLDVAGARHRTGSLGLSRPHGRVARLPAAAGDHRVRLVSVSPDRRPRMARHGPHDVRRLRPPHAHRQRLRRTGERGDQGEEGRHGELRARRDLQVLLSALCRPRDARSGDDGADHRSASAATRRSTALISQQAAASQHEFPVSTRYECVFAPSNPAR